MTDKLANFKQNLLSVQYKANAFAKKIEKLQGELDEIKDTIMDIEQRVEQYAQSLEKQGSVELDY